MNPQDSRLEALQRYVDGRATAADVAAVECALLDDGEFRDFAVEYLYLDGVMEEFAVRTEVAPLVKVMPRRRWALAAAAAALAVAGCSFWVWVMTPAAPRVLIEVMSVADAEFGQPSIGLRVHDRVEMEALVLHRGEVRLRLSSQVEMAVTGPAELRFLGAMHARVRQGKVTVDVGPRGQGFILDTPVARVVDRGTRFGVEARMDGATDVMVIKGSVELFHPRQSQPAAPLQQGEAVRVNAAQDIARIVNITGGLDPDDWSTEPPPTDCAIASVSDNFGAAEGFHFYRIVPHGLRAGAVSYSNRPHVWKATDGGFPAALENADLVQTFFGELRRSDYAIGVEVKQPIELFVLMPRRGISPVWLTENFTRTGDALLLEEGGAPPPRPRPPHFFDVWKRTIAQSGKVTLGPGSRTASGDPVGMYGIAAKAL